MLNWINNLNNQNCQSHADGKSTLGLEKPNFMLNEIAPKYITWMLKKNNNNKQQQQQQKNSVTWLHGHKIKRFCHQWV